MYIIRPIQQSDFKALQDIAADSGVGFTSLPVNDELLTKKIKKSVGAFERVENCNAEGSYLFIMEDSATGEVVGTTGIEAAVGTEDAFYHYHLGKVVHASRELNIHNTVDTLTLCSDYSGVSEICTLFLKEKARKGVNGRLLSKVRFLFMAEHQARFAKTVIAEMRGVNDENGRSPFWEWLEAHFFSLDFPTADYLTGIGNKVFIAELMPKYPIYVNLLSQEAQAVIGKVHSKTAPALKLLQEEGFSFRGYVDIFDAGPTVEADLSHITTAQRSRRAPVNINNTRVETGKLSYIINTKIAGFKAVAAAVAYDKDSETAIISQATADALNLVEGEYIRFATVKPRA